MSKRALFGYSVRQLFPNMENWSNSVQGNELCFYADQKRAKYEAAMISINQGIYTIVVETRTGKRVMTYNPPEVIV